MIFIGVEDVEVRYFFLFVLISFFLNGCSEPEHNAGTKIIEKNVVVEKQQVGYILETATIEISPPLGFRKQNQILFSQKNTDMANFIIASFKLPSSFNANTPVLKIENIWLDKKCDAKYEFSLSDSQNQFATLSDNREIHLLDDVELHLRIKIQGIKDCTDVKLSFTVSAPELEEQKTEMVSDLLDYGINGEDGLSSSSAVLFTGNWCGACKMISPVLSEMNISLNLNVHKINIDTEMGGRLAALYGIRSIPTVFFVKDHSVSKPSIGLRSMTQLKMVLDNL